MLSLLLTVVVATVAPPPTVPCEPGAVAPKLIVTPCQPGQGCVETWSWEKPKVPQS